MSDTSRPLVLELTCALGASADRVFTALTDPAELPKWWGPSGFTTPVIWIDLKVGGGYRLGMQPPDGELFHLVGEFLEIDAPTRLAYTFRWEDPDPDDVETVVRLFLEAEGSGTRVSLRQSPFATDARLALHRAGWTDSLQRLTELLT
ncbi:SRPBCC family protein [Humibacillus xanthopallidus]|uniref:Uncharacterized protein YndB with AHSA1/START domain n=1 Tax=Humibacillus xanthopallidus TaxID=412689 RepID=A0A543HU95_9MICO|nr:SRPBCC domain-containing protein [Humibacillus xanthopallidus]TQM61872.1 uncharacterized protein YndB with AHSA1/START domain [Humibacillus xanthopallidus]